MGIGTTLPTPTPTPTLRYLLGRYCTLRYGSGGDTEAAQWGERKERRGSWLPKRTKGPISLDSAWAIRSVGITRLYRIGIGCSL